LITRFSELLEGSFNMLGRQEIEKIFAELESQQPLDGVIRNVEEAIRNGKSQLAYERSIQATQIAPDNAEAWLLRASLAPSLEERVLCVNRLNELEPNHPDKHHVAFYTLKEMLEKDPFLGYLEESEQLYHVVGPDHRVLSIPKKRAAAAPPPHLRKDQLAAAHRWLTFAFFGLMSAGILTLVFAPLAAWSAIHAGRTDHSDAGRVRSAVVVFSSTLFFVAGLFFTFLLVLHLIG
jgi:hypothetical protein